jgi:anti-sigma factor RsiW
MVLFDQQTRCVWVCDRLDLYLDRDLPPSETEAIRSHLGDCADCASELARAQEVLGTLRALPILTCPEEVTIAVRKQIGPAPSFWRRLWTGRLSRPALVGAVAVALLAVTAIVGRYQAVAPRRIDSEELAVARAEAKWALALVGGIARRMERTVRQEVFDPHLMAPLRRAVEKSRVPQSRFQSQEVHHEG